MPLCRPWTVVRSVRCVGKQRSSKASQVLGALSQFSSTITCAPVPGVSQQRNFVRDAAMASREPSATTATPMSLEPPVRSYKRHAVSSQ
eukprot:CAMPEP_0119519218 /NCGR_PEP_ID=MMETSP1344-20130328/35593_1 /TAXON_ID=236787 /ORGANISM="Florenciella parvula, Strain CCMP2471" /LENGTH=88 /DNA_ID=CAMNT_0007556969 /DNA_START=715 /DNA_END=978 /DNA_ORIENTATION=+